MRVDDVPDDGQAEPKAAVCAGLAVMLLAEPIEERGQEIGVNPDAGVDHGKLSALAVGFDDQLHLPAIRGELDGVGQEVRGHLLQTNRISRHRREP